jgi:hypothetical protein
MEPEQPVLLHAILVRIDRHGDVNNRLALRSGSLTNASAEWRRS